MLVREVMTSPALTVRVETPVKAALALLDELAITMLPVVSATGTIVGVLSEADVVRDALPRDLRRHLIPVGELGPAGAHTVADLMNMRPVTVTGVTDLAAAAMLMTDTAVKSLPVVDDEARVVGVVSRRDIIHVLARPDEVIEAELDDLYRQLDTDWLVDVRDGAVTVSGPADEAQRSMAEAIALSVPGVRAVELST
jgi:CBS domain-containing protein